MTNRVGGSHLVLTLTLTFTGVAVPAIASQGLPPLQPGDDAVRPIDAVKTRSEAEGQRVEAISHFMAGRIHELRNRRQDALREYETAVKLDPQSREIYRSLVPLAFSLGAENAVQYGNDAVKLDPDDYELLQMLGIYMATQRQIERGISYLEQARKSKRLERKSRAFVMIQRDLSILYRATGKIEEAADCYETIFDAIVSPRDFRLDFRTHASLRNDPRTSLEHIGEGFLEAKRPERAIEAFRQAAKARRGKPGTLNYNLARVYLETGQNEEALGELEKYLNAHLQSKGKAPYELLSAILVKLERSDELVPRLEELAGNDARNATLQFYLAASYAGMDRLDDAIALYEKTLKFAAEPDGFFGLADVLRKKNEHRRTVVALADALRNAGATTAMEERLAQYSESAEFSDALIENGLAWLSEEPPPPFEEVYVFARLSARRGNTPGVTGFYERAIKERPDQRLLTEQLYREYGGYLMDANDFKSASAVFMRAAGTPALGNQKPLFLYFASQALELDGETERALAAIEEAQQGRQEIGLLKFQEAWIHYHSRNWDRAQELFRYVIEKFPQDKDIVRRSQFSLSNIYVQSGDIQKGEAILERILVEDPDDPSVNNDLGYLYADQGKNLEKAEKMIRKAVTAEPENAAYIDSMGWVLFKLGRPDEALEWLQKVAGMPDGQDATIFEHLGDCQDALGQQEKALESWKKALKLATDAKSTDEKLLKRLKEKVGAE